MYEYSAYGLNVTSDIPLPGFRAQELVGAPTVSVCRTKIGHGEDWEEENDWGNHLVGFAPDTLRFRVKYGETIEYDPDPAADMDFVQAILSGELMAALLRQRGFLVLHAACVGREGKAIAFLGDSGWGKSTTAMHFARQGYRLLCDDVLAIDVNSHPPQALPGPTRVKLAPDAGGVLVDDYDVLPEAYTGTRKRLLVPAQAHEQEGALELQKIYVLEPISREENEIVDLPVQQAFSELVRHTRVTRLLTATEFRRAHFDQCTALMESVHMSLLRRRYSLDGLYELGQVIEADWKEPSELEC